MSCAKSWITTLHVNVKFENATLCVDGPLDVEPSTSDADDALLMNKPANAKHNRTGTSMS